MQHSWLIHYLGKDGRANTGCPKPKVWELPLTVLPPIWTSPLLSSACVISPAANCSENATPWERLHCALIIFCSCTNVHDLPGEVFWQKAWGGMTFCNIVSFLVIHVLLYPFPTKTPFLLFQKQHLIVSCTILHISSFPWRILRIFYPSRLF